MACLLDWIGKCHFASSMATSYIRSKSWAMQAIRDDEIRLHGANQADAVGNPQSFRTKAVPRKGNTCTGPLASQTMI